MMSPCVPVTYYTAGSRSSLRKKKPYKRGCNTEFYIAGHGQETLPKSVVLYRCKIGGSAFCVPCVSRFSFFDNGYIQFTYSYPVAIIVGESYYFTLTK